MRYDRDMWGRGSRSRGGYSWRGGAASGGGRPRGEHGEAYEGPFSGGWSEGFPGGELRSRGSWDPRNQDTFEWGGGYIGGRGYGGGNYDLEHGYATGGRGFGTPSSRGSFAPEGGGHAWGEGEMSEEYGPARYGYGPYFDRLRRRRRSDDELRQEVEDTLFYDTWVDADAISIAVDDGVVTLRGTLPSFEELRYAVDDAWDVDGVRGVRSELDVRERGERGDRSDAGERGGTRAEKRVDGASGRYQQGAPHMHGHPQAGSSPARATSGRGRQRGAESEGDAGTPMPGAPAGKAASGSRPGKRRSRSRAQNPDRAGDGSVGLSQS